MSAYERIIYLLSRVICKFGYHSLCCRGRANHSPYIGRWTQRW